MKARRDDAVTEKHRRIEEETEEKRRKKREKEKLALNEQMRVSRELVYIVGVTV